MIKPLNKYDTRAVIKITEWKDQGILDILNQRSVVDDEYFIREVQIEGELCHLIERLHLEGNLVLEVLSTKHNPSEKFRQEMKEVGDVV